MRTLTSVRSSNQIITNLQLSFTPVDQSTTFVFSNWHIQNLTPVSYEIDFLGGFSKSSTYQVTLSRDDGLTFWKNNFRQFIKAEVALTVNANSDSFTPHVGIVQDITRFPNDPNLIQFQVFDKLFDNVPQFPTQAIVDSYTDVHPEVSNNNWGYPAYYGKHTRPFYMTPVDCDLGTLVGPVNVSSENHVSSLYFNRDKSLGFEGRQLIFLNKTWAQQSGATNRVTGGDGFEIKDRNIEDSIWKLTATQTYQTNITSASLLTIWTDNHIKATAAYQDNTAPQPDNSYLRIVLNLDNRLKIKKTNDIFFSASITNTPTATPQSWIGTLEINSNAAIVPETQDFFSVVANIAVDSTALNSNLQEMGNLYQNAVIQLWYIENPFTISPIMQFSCDWQVTLKSENYINYSIHALPVNCSDIAISENPIHILTDIFSQSNLTFRQSQASDSQLNTANSGYGFQCFFGERQTLTEISQEFGEITGTYIFVSDSGQINFRSYQESGDVTVNKTITPDDYLGNSLKILDNPLGTTIYDTEKARRIIIGYNYNFTTGQYENSLVADKNNTAACNSIDATGITNEIERASKYFLNTDTASMYLSNILRKRTQDEQIVTMDLPAQYFDLELADVIKLEHPILENSESLFQITKMTPDYVNGKVSITANQLINL